MFIRSSDGQLLIVSSSDGFCSIVNFSKEELGVPYIDNTKVATMEIEELVVQKDNEIPNNDIMLKMKQNKDNISNKDISLEIKQKEEKSTLDFSEPPTKKRIQLVTLSSPKNKKHLNK